MHKHTTWIALGMLLAGCQTHVGPTTSLAQSEKPSPAEAFEAEAARLTEGHGDVVLFESFSGDDRKVALVVRYAEHPPSGEQCRLSIVEQIGDKTVIVETSDEILACGSISVIGIESVKHSLQASVEAGAIRLDEDHIRNRSEYEFSRGNDGRWRLAYAGDIGPENNPDGEDLLVVSYTVAYGSAEGPMVSDIDRLRINKERVRSVFE